MTGAFGAWISYVAPLNFVITTDAYKPKSCEDIVLVLWSFQGAVPSTAEESAFLWFRVNYESLIGKDFMCRSGCWIGKISLLLPFF